MFKELDVVVLRRDLPKHDLKEGDMGAIVACYKAGGYEVEFTTVEGATIAVVTVSPSDIRPVAKRDVMHVRELQRSAA